MRLLLIALCLFPVSVVFSQEDKITDKLLEDICESIRTNPSSSDSAKLSQAFEKHLGPLFSTMDSAQVVEAWDRVFFRLQVKCVAFKRIIAPFNDKKGDWETVEKRPVAAADAGMCRKLDKHVNLAYLEPTGDTVHVTVKDGIWTERFKDNSYSKLRFSWVKDCEFHLEFVESNNITRKNMSRPGDKYIYQVLNNGEGYYSMSAEFMGRNYYATFKIYY